MLARADVCEAPPPSEAKVSAKAISLPLPAIAMLRSSSTTGSLIIGGVEVNDIKLGPLNEKDRESLISLLSSYNDCIASTTQELGCTDLIQMNIKLTTDQPVYRQPYRLSHKEQEIVQTKVRELLDAGIIKESESNYASPVILVKKKNGDSRLCVDYRALNAITVKDRYLLPNIDDQVSKLAGKKYFTSLDLAQSYHQVKINPDDTHNSFYHSSGSI